jgi:hypothetical protein
LPVGTYKFKENLARNASRLLTTFSAKINMDCHRPRIVYSEAVSPVARVTFVKNTATGKKLPSANS